MVKGFTELEAELPVFAELNNNWHNYGPTRVIIDRSLNNVPSFTYEDLVATGADVLWISNPAGGLKEYSEQEIEAVMQYASEGHHVFGTFRVFRYFEGQAYDNRELAPLFGLPEVAYNFGPIITSLSFSLENPAHPVFNGISDPFLSMGFNRSQAPNNDSIWSEEDLGMATLLAATDDKHSVITFYDAGDYHAVYVSVFVEFVADPVDAADTQFIYNVLTLDAVPTGSCCLGDGLCDVVEQSECAGEWTQGGTCDPNPCPQLGACCAERCFISFESECLDGRWTEGIDCVVDDDEDGVIDACDVCLGFDDSADEDKDGVPDGCDRCPGFNDALDQDEDGVPDDCDVCPGFDDRLDEDGDGIPDDCDICPGFDDNKDCDGDGTPDGCDTEPDCNSNGIPDHCEIDAGAPDCDGNDVPDDCQPDTDDDGVIDPCDICIGDDTLIGDPCDSELDVDDCATGLYECATGTLTCTDDAVQDDVDDDGDGVYNCNDLCPDTPLGVIVLPDGCRPEGACCFSQAVCFDAVPPEDCDLIGGFTLGIDLTCDGDPDDDGAVGCEDGCPLDRAKRSPGQCGCGTPDTDSDQDGTADCNDNCPDDPDKIEPGLCGCGIDDGDSDGDGVIDCQDGCPDDPDKIEPGICGCGEPDVDSDMDGALDCDDRCPNDPDKTEPGECGCGEPDVDSDKDGALDCNDRCPNDPNKTEPGACGCGVVEDTSDEDGDGVIGCFDLCPDTDAMTDVDEDGCPLAGACCFNVGLGICISDAALTDCSAVGGRYQGNGSTCAGGCAYPINGDINADGIISLIDTASFNECMMGPNVLTMTDTCDTFDLDLSDTVDLADFAAMQNAFGQED